MHLGKARQRLRANREHAKRVMKSLKGSLKYRLSLNSSCSHRKSRCPLQSATLEVGQKACADRGRQAFKPEDMLRSAFGSHPRIGMACLQLGISRRTVTRHRCVVAAFVLHMQLLLLGVLLLMAAAERPLYVICREAFDETTHRFCFKMSHDLAESMQSSSWHVLVFRLCITIGWSGRAPIQFEVILPPIVVLSTAAASLYSALTTHPQYLRIFNAVTMLRQASHRSIRLLFVDITFSFACASPRTHRAQCWPPLVGILCARFVQSMSYCTIPCLHMPRAVVGTSVGACGAGLAPAHALSISTAGFWRRTPLQEI
jgi:hypothetical protein